MSRQRRLPAEWETQDAILLTWPHAAGDWEDLSRTEAVFLALADAICANERLVIACHDEAHRIYLTRTLIDRGIDPRRFACHIAPSNDSWARDHGPVTVFEDGHPLLCSFRFDGWGGKYPAELDDRITARLHAQGAFGDTPCERIELVVEGGNLDSDGQGTVLCNGPCLHDHHRNPDLDGGEVDARLRLALGIERLLSIEHGRITGDDTGGHIDMLARFCNPRTIVHCRTDDPADPDHAELEAMVAELSTLRDRDGRPYRLVPLPCPTPCHAADGRRLPASYANFLVINGAVLVPAYGCPADDEAASLLSGLFPGRRAIEIDCRPLIEQNGSLHCVTMQLPAGVLQDANGGDR